MGERDDTDNSSLTIDFTMEETQEWRTYYEEYLGPPLFDEDGDLQNGFIGRFDVYEPNQIKDSRWNEYIRYLATQLDYVCDDRDVEAWSQEDLQLLAEQILDTFGAERVFKVRRRILDQATQEQKWGVSRYQYLNEELAVNVMEAVGPTVVRNILDVRPKYQFDTFAEENPITKSPLFSLPEIPNRAFTTLCTVFDVSEREVAREALDFHETLTEQKFVNWYRTSAGLLDLANLSHERWRDLSSTKSHISIVDLVSALGAVLYRQRNEARTASAIKCEIKDHLQYDPEDPSTAVSALSDIIHVRPKNANLLKQIFKSTQFSTSKSTAYQSVAAGHGGFRKSDLTQEIVVNAPPVQERESKRTNLFIIPAGGKPTEVHFTEIDLKDYDTSEYPQLSGLEESSFVVYAAPQTQKPAVDRMATDDIVLFYTGESYMGEYHVVNVLKAPRLIGDIWPDSRFEDSDIAKYPYLILLRLHEYRTIPQDELNFLLGYTSTSVPSRWAVAEQRIENLTNAGFNLSDLLKDLDQRDSAD